HGEHHAGRHHRGAGRPRAAARDGHRLLRVRRGPAGVRGAGRPRHPLRRRRDDARGRRRTEVRRLLEGTTGLGPGPARRARQGDDVTDSGTASSPATPPGVSVSVSGELAGAVKQVTDTLLADGVPARLAGGDAALWGPDAEPEAAIRLGWLDLPRSSRDLLPRLAELRAELAAEGLDHVVLAGMGGSSLAPAGAPPHARAAA